jgi:hypothetical protein
MTNYSGRGLRILFVCGGTPLIVLLGVLGVTLCAWLPAEGQGPPRDVRAPAPATQPPRDARGDAQNPVIGKGSITGVVVVAGSGQPARRARVNLSAPEAGNRTTTTDDLGRFAFSALPVGRFNLSASKPGHLNATYGQRSPGRSGTPIQLADGQRLQVQMQIWRGGVITGTVLDEHGEAIPNTPVRALRYVLQNGQRTLQQAGTGQTDDRGTYRIFGLQPGDYLISAVPRNASSQPAMFERMQAIEALAQNTARMAETDPQQAKAMTLALTQLKSDFETAQGDDQPTGYAPVFYPGTTAPSSAVPIAVSPSEEKSGIDFQYQVVPVARVEGVVTISGAQMPPNVQVTLVNTAPGLNAGSTRADAQGTFRIPNVPPGQYTLVARAMIGGGRMGGPAGRGIAPGGRDMVFEVRGRAGAMTRDDATRFWASADITVDGRNISNIVLTLQPGVTVSGRIAFDGATQQPPADLSRLRVSLQPVVAPGTAGEITSAASGRVDADGRFTIGSVVPGRYKLNASGAGAGWFLESAVLEGQDSLDFPVDIKGAVSSAVVTFTDRHSELTGLITNDQSQPVTDYTLILYPVDARYRSPQSRRILSTRPATDGRFTFRTLPAGDYRLAPVLEPEPGVWFDPAYLQELDSGAIRVSIAEGEKKEQNLRVPGGL